MPKGWPMATEPPLTLHLSSGILRASMLYRDTTAKASFTSHRSMSSTFSPGSNVFTPRANTYPAVQTMTLKETGHCDRGADTHLFGRAPGNGKSIEPAQRLESSLLHLLLLHQHTSTRTIRQLAGVASSDRSLGILVDIHWLEFGKAVQRRVRAIAFIFGHNVFLLAHFASLLVFDKHFGWKWHDFVIEQSLFLSFRRPLLRNQRVLILSFPRHSVPLSNQVRRVDHGHP
mmetsp:Transcript_23976/g.77959  ORF Transcript_23976/g.77959 Transcript_23976/m.77959 type:complete len:230 (+) Transcript_23976:1045-1734(+)